TPREVRRDAGLGAATLVLAADELVRSGPPDRVVNVGRLTLAPGAHNIVPAEARVALEIRAADEAGLRELESALRTRAREAADRHGLELATHPLGEVPPTPCDPGMRDALARAADSLGLRWLELTSGAGHDTMVLGRL
ncbi:MAG: Zn-dependent hydrolase, partial [Actinobacteria bacterium]|nr:Zn-dependent hydrolase [Actinomycetota bacterium]NIS36595.1 Zn-dependent hydrolase [Actinomycetota bacterium]NIU71084.1 Zn-dependent hydrolase [Actinomycetota bacterium]NIW33038.1 Zn-dependent hydrolase [Actinomycetota bacterium]NIX25189.1 Zn-dependent hydrolase [Actinomycetota bacterium]